jgi:hypothetical protein
MHEKKKKRRDMKSDETRISEQVTTLSEKPKRGRPTTPDNLLLGTRNAWVALLEESWPEIGWQMRRIRARRKGNIEDIRKLFEPVKQNIHNSDLPASFYRRSTESAKPSETLKNRKRVGQLDAQILQTQAQRDEQQRSSQTAEAALKQSSPGHRDTIQNEATKRLLGLTKIEDDLKTLQSERDALEKKLRDQEAYVNRSELLEFLLSRGRYAIKPRNVADALAGLPGMKWRQSYTRCSHMPRDADARPTYRVFEVISHIWDRRPQEFEAPPIDFFRSELLKHPQKSDSTRQFMQQRWSDLKLAIEDCWNSVRDPLSIPSVITAIFMRNVSRQKNPAEQILAELESLET